MREQNQKKVCERIVIKLSGALFKEKLEVDEIRRFANLFTRTLAKDIQPIIITGGGEAARRYIDAARSLGADEATLDEIGIAASRLNASLLLSSIGEAGYPHIPTDLEEVAEAVDSSKIVVLGGLHPGHSTNATAALVAEKVKAKLFVNATDVDGVYSADPKLVKAARRFEEIDVKQLMKLVEEEEMKAGTYELMDLVALKVISRSSISTRIVKCEATVVEKAIAGEEVGTLVFKSR